MKFDVGARWGSGEEMKWDPLRNFKFTFTVLTWWGWPLISKYTFGSRISHTVLCQTRLPFNIVERLVKPFLVSMQNDFESVKTFQFNTCFYTTYLPKFYLYKIILQGFYLILLSSNLKFELSSYIISTRSKTIWFLYILFGFTFKW